jgi:fibronectin type 3 domain-containing protein
MKAAIIIFIGFLFVPIMMSAQNKKQANNKAQDKVVLQSGIRVIGKAYGDSIVLRWAPSKSWAWLKLNIIGYKIERIDVSDKDNPKKEWLTSEAIKPFPLEKFKASFTRDNTNAAIAAQCLYGKNFETNLRQGQAGIVDRASVSDTRFAFALQSSDFDRNVATATALRFVDKKVKKGGAYIYRLVPAAIATQGIIDTGSVLIINSPITTNPAPEITEALSFDRLAEFHWDRAGVENWSGYYIERSEDGKVFNPLNKIPFITSRPDSSLLKEDSSKAKIFAMLQTQHIYIDSLPQNYKKYFYRIRGINAFAELSPYSNAVTIFGKDLTPPVAVNILNPEYISGKRIKVKWQKEIIEKDCMGYYIARAKNINGPYETLNDKLLPTSNTDFIDNNAFEHGENFYVVIAVDTASNISTSVPAMCLVPDSTPPAAPAGLKGRIDSSGRVYLSWDKNKEEDLKGYKVYFANAADHVFIQISAEPDLLNSFVDSITLHTLSKDIWYKIAAVDFNNNHSAFSPAVKLRKPVTVRPTAPIATNVKVNKTGIEMDWIQSSSDDISNYKIYRQQEGNAKKLLAIYKPDPAKMSFHFTDTTVRANLIYNYTAEAVNEDSIHSPSSIAVQVKIHATSERPAITTLKAVYDRKGKVIKLNWTYADSGDYFFLLYRSVGNDPLERMRSFDKEVTQFDDYNLPPGKIYHYAIQAIYKDANGNTKLSVPIDVTIPVE